MRAVVQRVSEAAVLVEGEEVARIGPGLVVLLGICRADTMDDAVYLAEKIVKLRIFTDAADKLNLSLQDVRGALLVVSQFTLYGDCRKGRRPGFDQAAPADQARPLYQHFLACCRAAGVSVAEGHFQAHMLVQIANDGPVTMLLDSKKIF